MSARRQGYNWHSICRRWAIVLSLSSVAEPVVAELDVGTDRTGANVQLVHALFGLTGQGINVGQIHERPGDADISGERFFHPNVDPGGPSTIGVAVTDDSGRVIESDVAPLEIPNIHGTQVAGMIISNHKDYPGSAPKATLWSVVGREVEIADITSIEWVRSKGARITNSSYGYDSDIRDATSLLTKYMDWLAFEHDVLAVQANPESEWVETDWHDIKGIPDDAYNSLLVSMTMPGTFLPRSLQRFDRIVYVEGEGKQLPNVIESRVLTSLSAPGRMEKVPMFFDTDDDGVYDSTGFGPVAGTSFAAPLTAGVAALLEQWGKAGNKPQGHLVEKVVLMNSASKHLQDIAGVHWMDSPAATDTRESLDDEMGIGSLNALAAVRQYQPATRTDLGVRTGTNQGEVDTYSLGKLSRGSLVTAALVWDAPVSNDATGDERLYDADNFVRGTFQDLALQLARVNPSSEDGADTVRISQADAETTEHIYFNVREDGEYLLAVKNLTGTRNERFALSWTAGSSDGLSFSVDGGHFTPTRLERGETKPNPAIGSEAGISAAKFPNDVAALGTLGPAYLPTEGEIFVSARDGTNMQRLSAALGTRSRVGPHNGPPEASTLLDETLKQRGVLGLTPLDNLNGLSWGRDGSLGRTSVLIFSVDPLAEGVASTEVHSEAAGGQAAGDLFLSPKFASFGQYETYELFDFARREKNRLYVDEDRLGLLGTIEDLKPFEDDLDAIEIDSILDYVDRDGNGLHDAPVFFTLDEYSSSLGKNDRTPDDIFVSIPVDKTSGFSLDPDLAPSFSIYASGITDIGLKPGDVIDALVLSDTSSRRVPDGILQSERDEALFSLAAGSPSLDPDGQPGSSDDRSPADVFYTKFNASFSLYAGHNDLGLLFADELDALDVNSVSPFVIPEPSAILLMIIGACYTGRLSRVRRDAS